MNNGKKWPHQHGPQIKPNRKPGQPTMRGTLQPKAVAMPQAKRLPAAPPVYRPQPTPKVLQSKAAQSQPPASNSKIKPKLPIAPPVYRPQPTPKVLQSKMPGARQLRTGHSPNQPVNTPGQQNEQRAVVQRKVVLPSRKPHAIPAVERQEPKKIVRAAGTGATIQAFWLRKDGKVVWDDKKLSSSKYRITGESKWYSSWKPREFNELLDVYEETPEAINTGVTAIPQGSQHLHLRGNFLDETDLGHIGGMHHLTTLELTACKFPAQWSMNLWAHLNQLRYLSINNPNTFQVTDGMQGIAGLRSLRVLKLTRCDFVNDIACYNTLGGMHQLTHLELDRTITKEKAVGQAITRQTEHKHDLRQVTRVDSSITNALKSLICHGSLRQLSIKWCTALSDGQVQRLLDGGFENNCRVVVDRNLRVSWHVELGDLLDRIK